ncbi:MAG: TonB-dependent receptor, partial [Ignavibacteriaceae bacterium]|nr:TonB-dependent receptor [Ignavibacteriaceae bacterium]
MLKRLRYIIPLFFLVALLTADLTAQSGKVSGRVTDKVTNEALPFVNVIIVGTTQGAATDLDGYYNILNVAPGTYTIKASAIGYNPSSVSEVRVSIDLTSRIDFVLSETSLTLKEEVIVVATKPLVTKDLTSSTAIVGADDIAALPVTEFQEVLGLKAGVVGNSVRGGRSGEVVYAIDGVPVTDVYDGGTVVDVNANSIQELQFVSGAFNAEYGKALSGYVNIATKDGKNTFEGNFTTYFGDYYSNRTDIFRAVDDFDPLSIHNFEGSLSGPIIPNSLYFYGNFRYVYFGGWLNGKRVYNPWDITKNLGASVPLESRYDIQKTGDGEIVPMNWNEKVYGQGKLTYRVLPEIKLTYNYILDDVEYRDYDHSFAYNPDGDFKKFRTGHTNILGMTHTLGSSTFYQLNLSYFFKRYRQFVYENYKDPKYTHNELLGQSPADVPSFRTGGTQSSHFKRTTGTYGVKFDITSQLTQSHQVKGGVEFNRHNLSFDNVNLIQPDGIGSPKDTRNPYVTLRIPEINNPAENLAIDIYTKNPVEFSAYIQDKIELSELIINIGLRYDMFMPDGKLLVDPTDPNIYNPLNPANIAKTLAERKTYWYKDATTKSQLSPRLGVAFPITDRGVIHFSYGYFFQIPPFDLLYSNPEFKFGQGTGNLGIAGNSDLRPQGTISGEVGVQQAITDDISIDLTAYFRDIRDLAGTRADEITLFGGSGRYSQFVNSDFGFVKGIVFTMTKRFSDGWSATLDYTLQSAKGNASDPAATRNALVGGALPEIQLTRLNQDQTHTINVTFAYAAEQWGVSMIGSYGSGFPYTPNQSINLSTLLTNSETKPTYFNADFRAYYDFKIMDTYKISFFTRIYNLFDIRNEVNVYGDSGTADFTVEEFLRRQQNLPAIVNTLD